MKNEELFIGMQVRYIGEEKIILNEDSSHFLPDLVPGEVYYVTAFAEGVTKTMVTLNDTYSVEIAKLEKK